MTLLIVAAGFFLLVVGFDVLWTRRSRRILNVWIRANDYSLLSAKRRRFRQGRWTLRVSTTGHRIFNVVVEDNHKIRHTGLVRITWYMPTSSDAIEGEWFEIYDERR